jgi:hypothetical protein
MTVALGGATVNLFVSPALNTSVSNPLVVHSKRPLWNPSLSGKNG